MCTKVCILRIGLVTSIFSTLLPDFSAHPQDADQAFAPLTEDRAPTNNVEGIVVDPNGGLVRNATVSLNDDIENGTLRHTTLTDRAGRFIFTEVAESNRWNILVDHPAYARTRATPPNTRVPGDPERPPITIPLKSPVSFAGIVLDVDGTPLPGVIVTTARAHYAANPDENRRTTFAQYAETTDEFGRFRLTRLHETPGAIWISHPTGPPMQFEDESYRSDGVFQFKPPLTMIGCIHGPDGKHLPDVNVYIDGSAPNPFMESGPYFGASAKDGHFIIEGIQRFNALPTDTDSRFSVRIDDARFREDLFAICISDPDRLPFVEIHLRDASAPGGHRFVPIGCTGQDDRGTIRVRPSTPIGTKKVDVKLNRREQERRYTKNASFHNEEALFEFVESGDYLVQAEGNGMIFQPKKITLQPGQELVVEIEAGAASLSGRVMGLIGSPEEWKVGWVAFDEQESASSIDSVRISPDATYLIEAIPPGYCELHIELGGNQSGRFTLTLQPGENIFDIAVPSTTIEGRVTGFEINSTFDDPKFVLIEELQSEWDTWPGHSEGMLDSSGAFAVHHLRPGTYNVSYRDEKTRIAVSEKVLLTSPNATAYVELAAPKAFGQIEGTIAGLVPPQEEVQPYIIATSILDAGRNGKSAMIDPQTGRYQITQVQPGVYGLSVYEGKTITWHTEYEVRANTVTVADLQIPPSREVAFHLSSLNTPVRPIAVIRLTTADGGYYPFETFMGHFGPPKPGFDQSRTVGLPLGAYIVEALIGKEFRHVVPFELTPGDEPLLIEISND